LTLVVICAYAAVLWVFIAKRTAEPLDKQIRCVIRWLGRRMTRGGSKVNFQSTCQQDICFSDFALSVHISIVTGPPKQLTWSDQDFQGDRRFNMTCRFRFHRFRNPCGNAIDASYCQIAGGRAHRMIGSSVTSLWWPNHISQIGTLNLR
jgi:hypothetical protein